MSEETLEEIKYYSEMYPDGIHKKSQAEEMFKKLDYFTSSEYFEEELVYNLHTEDIEEWRYISFDLINKRIELGDWEEGFYLTLKELQAINKQIEELGWNK